MEMQPEIFLLISNKFDWKYCPLATRYGVLKMWNGTFAKIKPDQFVLNVNVVILVLKYMLNSLKHSLLAVFFDCVAATNLADR